MLNAFKTNPIELPDCLCLYYRTQTYATYAGNLYYYLCIGTGALSMMMQYNEEQGLCFPGISLQC